MGLRALLNYKKAVLGCFAIWNIRINSVSKHGRAMDSPGGSADFPAVAYYGLRRILRAKPFRLYGLPENYQTSRNVGVHTIHYDRKMV